MAKVSFSEMSLETLEGTHVYVPDLQNDYRSIHTGKPIKTIANPNPEMAMEICNRINLPPFCVATDNPGPKSYMEIRYQGKARLIEIFTFEKYINSFIGHMIVRDVEYLTQEIAREVASLLLDEVEVFAVYDLVGFKYGQAVDVRVKISREQAIKYRQEYPAKYQAYLDKKEAQAEQKAHATTCPVTGKTSQDCVTTTSDKAKHKDCPATASDQVVKKDSGYY